MIVYNRQLISSYESKSNKLVCFDGRIGREEFKVVQILYLNGSTFKNSAWLELLTDNHGTHIERKGFYDCAALTQH